MTLNTSAVGALRIAGAVAVFLLVSSRAASAQPSAKTITRADLAKNPDAVLKGRKIALLVGISDYKQEITNLPNLRYTVNDMMSVGSLLQAQGFSLSLLQESEATSAQIRTRLRNLATLLTKPEESTFLFYFSGHGFAIGKENYLATYGATNTNLQQQGLAVSEVYDLLENSGVRQRMAIIDACRNNPGAKGETVGRSIGNFERARGTKIMFSTAPGQFSYEDSEARQGLFTRFLLDGLRGGAAGADGLISWTDLTQFVENKMTDLSASDGNRIQIPYTAGESTGDFLLARRAANYEAPAPPATVVAPVPARTDQPVGPAPNNAVAAGTTRAGIEVLKKNSTISNVAALWQSSYHQNAIFTIAVDTDQKMYVYVANDLVGTLEPKVDKKTGKPKTWEGLTRIAPATGCPGGQGRMIVSELTENMIKAKIDLPSRNPQQGVVCGRSLINPIPSTVSVTFVKRQGQ